MHDGSDKDNGKVERPFRKCAGAIQEDGHWHDGTPIQEGFHGLRVSLFECAPFFPLCFNTIPYTFYSWEGKKLHVLTEKKVQAVQYNAILESTMPEYVPCLSGRRNDLGLKLSS